MRWQKYIWPIGIWIIILNASNPLRLTAGPELNWTVGEELVYSVKWSFISLGKLKLQVLSADSLDGRKVYHCRIRIDSNPSVPFVNIHDMYDSFIDAQDFYSHIFLSYEQKDDHVIYTRYDFNYNSQTVRMRMEKRTGENSETLLDSTAVLHQKVQDSLSLLYFARAMAKNQKNSDITVFAFNRVDTTRINFTGRKEKVEIHDSDMSGYFLDGRLKFVGIAGVKEDFKGWFSRDAQSVPLKAYMKAFVGSVRLEIEDWQKWDGDGLQKKEDR